MDTIIVIGTSAGGMEALKELVAQLPQHFKAPIFIVQHMAADTSVEPLLRALSGCSALPCVEARHDEIFAAGYIYLAPSDHHLLIKDGKMIVSKGARENRSRPGIDPLFRSAAVAYRSSVIGVILTGYLDDGSAGLKAIQRCGGISIVQDPKDAAYPDMPNNALSVMQVDHCLPIGAMGALLETLLERGPGVDAPVPDDIAIEAKIAERVLSDLDAVNALGAQVPFNCPDCGGVLWEVTKGSPRYRCHTGHAFTDQVLLAQQSAKIEETLWIALRMFEERRNLLRNMSDREGSLSRSAAERTRESEIHIGRIRSMLRSSSKATRDRDEGSAASASELDSAGELDPPGRT